MKRQPSRIPPSDETRGWQRCVGTLADPHDLDAKRIKKRKMRSQTGLDSSEWEGVSTSREEKELDYWPIKFHMHVTRAHRLCTLRM